MGGVLIYTSIIILTYNNLEYTKLCIESIRKYTKSNEYELIVVDNYSTDGTVEWLKKQNDIIKIYNSSNLGFAKGCNQGIELAKGDAVVFLNHDTIVTVNWLANLQKCLYSNEDIGAVGAVANNCTYYQAIPVSYQTPEEMHRFASKNNVSNSSKWEERLKLIAFCMMVKKSVIDKIGMFDERFTPALYEDADYSVRMRRNGYRLMLCHDVYIHHFGYASFQSQEEYDILERENRHKFEEKWGYDPGYSTNIRHEIVELIEDSKREIRVLEIGCACGGTLLYVKHKYPNAELHGIELNSCAAEDGQSFAKIIAANIENAQLPYKENSFDYIILADVLEHLQDPWGALKNLYKYLSPQGCFLASIPNIMHVSIIQNLLKGFWTYEESGILDKTHLRFFTFHEIKKMFPDEQFSAVEVTAKQKISPNDEAFISRLPIQDKSLAEQFTVFQYIIKAEKSSQANEVEKIITDISNKNNIEKNVLLLNQFEMEQVISCIKNMQLDKVELFNVIAVMNFSKGIYENIIPYLQAALDIEPHNSDALYNMAKVLYLVQEYDQALFYIKQIPQMDKEVMSLYKKLLFSDER